jgi:hypothetical protein
MFTPEMPSSPTCQYSSTAAHRRVRAVRAHIARPDLDVWAVGRAEIAVEALADALRVESARRLDAVATAADDAHVSATALAAVDTTVPVCIHDDGALVRAGRFAATQAGHREQRGEERDDEERGNHTWLLQLHVRLLIPSQCRISQIQGHLSDVALFNPGEKRV